MHRRQTHRERQKLGFDISVGKSARVGAQERFRTSEASRGDVGQDLLLNAWAHGKLQKAPTAQVIALSAVSTARTIKRRSRTRFNPSRRSPAYRRSRVRRNWPLSSP